MASALELVSNEIGEVLPFGDSVAFKRRAEDLIVRNPYPGLQKINERVDQLFVSRRMADEDTRGPSSGC